MGRRGKRKWNRKHGYKKGGNKKKPTKVMPKATMEETENTVVYFWSSKIENGGHVSLKLPKGVYISVRSLDEEYTVKVDKPSFPGHLDDDVKTEARQPDTTLNIPSALLHEDAILSWWQNFTEQKSYFLLKHQACQVIYTALRTGGADISEPLYWTVIGLERYVRKLCRRPTKNMFGDMFSFQWFHEMDALSRLLLFVMVLLLSVVVVMAVYRISPGDSDEAGRTCYNYYGPCNQYVAKFIKPSHSGIFHQGNLTQFALGVVVILICSRFSVDSVIKLLKPPKDDADDENDEDLGDVDDNDEDKDDNETNDEEGETEGDAVYIEFNSTGKDRRVEQAKTNGRNDRAPHMNELEETVG